jgi:hypothetical protein
LLCIFWRVDPLNMRLSLVILVHQWLNFIKFCFLLSFLFGIAILRFNIGIWLLLIFCLNISNFNGAESGGGILLFIVRVWICIRFLLLGSSVLRFLPQGDSMLWYRKITLFKLHSIDSILLLLIWSEEQKSDC